MPSRRRTRLTAQGRVTLQRLLEGGKEVVRSVGFHRASIDDVVRAAGVSRATFYIYFDDKNDFLRCLVADNLATILEAPTAAPAYAPGAEGLRRIREWLDRVCEAYDEHAALWRAWHNEESSDPVLYELGSVRLRQAISRHAEVLASSPGGDGVGHVPSAVLEAIATGGLDFVAPESNGRRGRDLDTVAALVFHGVYGEQAPRRVR